MLPACGAPSVMRKSRDTPPRPQGPLAPCSRRTERTEGHRTRTPPAHRSGAGGWQRGRWRKEEHPLSDGARGGQSPPPGTPSLIREMGNINMARTFIWLVLVLKISRNNLSYFQQIRLRILSIYKVHYTQSLGYPTDTEPSKTALQGGVVSAPTPTPLTRA